MGVKGLNSHFQVQGNISFGKMPLKMPQSLKLLLLVRPYVTNNNDVERDTAIATLYVRLSVCHTPVLCQNG